MSEIIAKTLIHQGITVTFIDVEGYPHYSNLAKYYKPGSVFKCGGASVEYQLIWPNGTIYRIDGKDVQFYDNLCEECLLPGVEEIIIEAAYMRRYMDKLFIISPEGKLYYLQHTSRLFYYCGQYYSNYIGCKISKLQANSVATFNCPFINQPLIKLEKHSFECPPDFPILVSKKYGMFNYPTGLILDKSLLFERAGRLYLLDVNGCYDPGELKILPNSRRITLQGDITLTPIIDQLIDSEPVFQYGDSYFNIKNNKIMSYSPTLCLNSGKRTKAVSH